MSWLIYLTLIVAPIVTYPWSVDSFQIKTLLISITGFLCLYYWLTKEWKGLAEIPGYFLWIFASFFWCGYRLGHSGEELLLTIAYLGIFLYARDYLNKEATIKAQLISLTLTIWYNWFHADSFVNKNIQAGWLIMIIPLALADVLKGSKITLLLFGAVVGELVGIGCRSALMGLISSFAVFSAFYWHRAGKWVAVAIIVISGLGWWFFTSHQVIDPVRSHFWQGELAQMQARPLTGFGYGSFSTIYPLYKLHMVGSIEGMRPDHFLDYSHNNFFGIICETGLIGLGLYLLLIYKAFKKANKKNIYNLAMIAGIFAALVDGFYNVALQYSVSGMIFFMFLGLLNKKEDNGESNYPSFSDRLYSLFLGRIL